MGVGGGIFALGEILKHNPRSADSAGVRHRKGLGVDTDNPEADRTSERVRN
ncbi:hypothetical protein ZHAS_00015720 [Anopheles sinensis]|uniref:Uncharacterized protein n=1 Tax=Anopheles sinensis TaxID=74873 RepID=A0A084WBT1_ANOSI|nr:hypothetical protein ZHAS_00015720 [Anopheles sinensis]